MTLRTVTTVTTPPAETDLTTIDRVNQELGFTTGGDTDRDNLLGVKIAEATSDIEAHSGRVFSLAGLTQQFWGGTGWAEFLVLDRAPVATITSVTVDGVVVASNEYRLDGDAGILYRLNSSGYPCGWEWCNLITIVYTAGYIVPGESGRNLPEAIEAATVDLVKSFWLGRTRDPLVRAEDVPGLGSVTYWVGAVGEAGQLPPGVDAKIAPFRRPRV